MKEHELLEKIFASAQTLETPDALAPEEIKKRLQRAQAARRRRMKKITAAACICICALGAGSAVFYGNRAQKQLTVQSASGGDTAADEAAAGITDDGQQSFGTAGGDTAADETAAGITGGNSAANTAEQAADADEPEREPLKKIGKLYTLAEDYGDVYDAVESSAADGFAYSESMKKENSAGRLVSDLDAATEDSAPRSAQDYSTTNLQVEGVDESDIVKADGDYIYIAQKEDVQILDIRNGRPKKAAVFAPDSDSASETICEMYVADGLLTLIVQAEETSLTSETAVEQDASLYKDMSNAKGSVEDCDSFAMDANAVTKVITCDISNPQTPVLKDTMTQDGWYCTSRKIGNRLYLFTDNTLWLTEEMRLQTDDHTAKSGVIPCVDGRAIDADSIYLQKNGNDGLLISSVALDDGCRVLDSKLLVHAYANYYVTGQSVYIYYTDYTQAGERTRIARFSLDDDGKIWAQAAASLRGGITDTFAICEQGAYLRVLTSDTSSEIWENYVYVLDENLKKTGKLAGLAKGEQIYAARFFGDTGYFVTYRNTDPLFAVDFSDPKNPEILGELKVTGFSDYLHFWDENRLLGVGYESDPQSGSITGVKVSMFDISDPKNVTEEARFVIKDADYCPQDYKAILVDRQKNMIAFATETYDKDGARADYHVFSYGGGAFTQELSLTLCQDGAIKSPQVDRQRSFYAGDVLYLANETETAAFDMTDHFTEIGREKY